MKLFDLARWCAHADATLGTLRLVDSTLSWATIERPWKENEPGVSCIPTGAYALRRGTFMAGGGYPDLEFVDVPGRQNIEIHAANWARELRGCIAPGKAHALGDLSVRHSKDALAEILAAIGDDMEIAIAIRWDFGK